jgi:hypothetical protein
MMKTTTQIRMLLAAGAIGLGVLAPAGPAAAGDATKPDYNYRPQKTDPNANDYHANYHADYSVGQDGRAGQPQKDEDKGDLRQDSRRFQDGERYQRLPYGWRR